MVETLSAYQFLSSIELQIQDPMIEMSTGLEPIAPPQLAKDVGEASP